MKKLLLLLLLGLFYSQTAMCQLQKGNIQMGGVANIYRSHSEVIDVGQTASKNFWNSTTLNPTLGYFITDKWVAGLSLNYNRNNSFNRLTTSNIMTNEYKSESWGSGLFVRRYFPLHEKFALFGEFQTNIYRQTFTDK